MSHPDELRIRKHTEEMIGYAYIALKQFPKAERHVLSAEIRAACWRLLRLIIICNKRYFKKTTLQELDAELDLLRSLVRMAHELGFLPLKKYEHLARDLDAIGGMTGNWIKAMRARA